jgi:hypothetical protein
MADVRCPQCNSINPDDAEKCWNCEASLQLNQPSPDSFDWLSDLRGGSDLEDQHSEPDESSPDDAETPDWLKRIRDRSQTESVFEESGDEAFPASDDLPDWLKDLSPEKEPEAGSEEIPEWLLEDAEESQPATPPLSEQEGSQAGEEALPDFFASQSTPEPTGAETAIFAGEDLPDWLSEVPAETEPEAEKPTGDETAVFAGEDLPDWLSEVPAETEPEAEKPTGAETAIFAGEDLPDWLSEVPAETEPEAEKPTGAETAVFAGEDLPDWLSEVPAETEPGIEPFEEISAPETAAQTESATVEEPEPIVPELEEDLAVTAFEMEELPDWLSEENVDLPQAEPTTSTPAFIMDENEEVDETVIEQAHPFSEEDIPAWLTAEDELESEETQSDDLTKTALPNWVEAMRPVDTVTLSSAAASAGEPHIEKAGPLAGLTGVLPADSTAIEYGRPPTYSMRLRVSDKQRASAALLETVLEEESKPAQLERERPGIPQAILRLLVGILLIAVIILSGGLSDVGSQGANRGSISAVSFNRQLDALPIGGTILLAVEFDPGYSAEMTLAGRGVIERLLARDNRLVLVSTSLAGPVLAEELVKNASMDGLIPGDRVTNLGFLAGGVISLREFSFAPQVAARYGMDWVRTGQPAWQHPALQNIQQVTDFSLVLVMTDSGDTGRMWIEQVRPNLGDVPLMMVTTAQAAPILNPYLTGGQLDGLISGISGGRAFGSQTLVSETESAWIAFRAGILTTVALILLGILFRGFSSLIPGAKS